MLRLIFKAVKNSLVFTALFFFLISCNSKKASFVEPDSTLTSYTARVIDSIVNIIDSNVSARFLKEDSTFKQFISSQSRRRVKNLEFGDSTRMVYYIEKCGSYCLRLRRSYFK